MAEALQIFPRVPDGSPRAAPGSPGHLDSLKAFLARRIPFKGNPEAAPRWVSAWGGHSRVPVKEFYAIPLAFPWTPGLSPSNYPVPALSRWALTQELV